MSQLTHIVDTVGIPALVSAENLKPYYDSDAFKTDMSDADHFLLRGQAAFYPVVVGISQGPEKSSYIPVGDHDAKKGGTYMGMLVAQSKIVRHLFVVQHLPQPADTPLPTRILTTFGGDKIYPPIQGFLLHQKRDMALLVGQDKDHLEIRRLGFMRGRRTVAGLVAERVERAVRKSEMRTQIARDRK